MRTCTFVCDAYHPRDRQGIVFICIYIGVSLRTLPCTLTRRRFPIFRPKLSTEKPRPSNRSLSLFPAPVRPRNPLSASRRPLPFSPRLSRSLAATLVCNVEPSYSDKIERIPPKRLRLHRAQSPSFPSPRGFSCRRRGRNIYYKPRVASGFKFSGCG